MLRYILYTTPMAHKRQRHILKGWYSTLSKCKHLDGTYMWCIALMDENDAERMRKYSHSFRYAECYPPIGGTAKLFATFDHEIKNYNVVREEMMLYGEDCDTLLGFMRRSNPKSPSDRMISIKYTEGGSTTHADEVGEPVHDFCGHSVVKVPEIYVALDPWKFI